jgi:hypothetical protein
MKLIYLDEISSDNMMVYLNNLFVFLIKKLGTVMFPFAFFITRKVPALVASKFQYKRNVAKGKHNDRP